MTIHRGLPLSVDYDDQRKVATLIITLPPPPAPSGIRPDLFFMMSPQTVSIDVNISKASVEAPTAHYVVDGSDPIERRFIQYVNGQWQMPGTIYTL